ncbi:HWE histidine kinase domain-containing protein [Bradyrhizobium cenepequi]
MLDQPTTSVNEICDAALDAVLHGLHCSRASILLLDDAGLMRFVAWRGLSDEYRAALEGLSPWSSDEADPQPVSIEDVAAANLPHSIRTAVEHAGIRALSFVPVMAEGFLIGKFMACYDALHVFTDDEMRVANSLARLLGFTINHKRSDETRLIANSELQHRCNNLLIVIQAIAHNTLASGGTVEQARAAFESRLQALARANRQLSASNWSGVSLGEIVRMSLEPFGTRAAIEGEEVTLTPKETQKFSLALHELATNAVKYGALSNAAGRISVAWTVAAGGGERVLRFRWEERGGPPIDVPGRPGFGTTLLKASFSDVCVVYEPDGLTCHINVRLCAARVASLAALRCIESRAGRSEFPAYTTGSASSWTRRTNPANRKSQSTTLYSAR